jgi:chromatin remodeling complex protein RSC6|tara:strand:+ start:492 stop:701 length:210 start_codon:yes stop_codon:yes gene_type:complete
VQLKDILGTKKDVSDKYYTFNLTKPIMKILRDIQKRRKQIFQKQHTLLFAAENIFNRHDPMFISSKQDI